MNTKGLLAHYERIAEAPDAISRMHRYILKMAVRGKLVSQDPNDEPINELLKRLAIEKERLINEGQIKRPRKFMDNKIDIFHLFEIPDNWKWVRLDTVGAIIGGGTPSANDDNNFAPPGTGIPWLTPADLVLFQFNSDRLAGGNQSRAGS